MAADVSYWINELSGPEPQRRAAAAEALAQMGREARPAAVTLVRAAGDEDESVCEWASAALEELGAPASEDIEPLVELIRDRSSDCGYWAVTLLGRLEDRAAPAVDALVWALASHPQTAVRQRAAWALGKLGPGAKSAAAALEKAAAGDDARLARLAQRALDEVLR